MYWILQFSNAMRKTETTTDTGTERLREKETKKEKYTVTEKGMKRRYSKNVSKKCIQTLLNFCQKLQITNIIFFHFLNIMNMNNIRSKKKPCFPFIVWQNKVYYHLFLSRVLCKWVGFRQLFQRIMLSFKKYFRLKCV